MSSGIFCAKIKIHTYFINLKIHMLHRDILSVPLLKSIQQKQNMFSLNWVPWPIAMNFFSITQFSSVDSYNKSSAFSSNRRVHIYDLQRTSFNKYLSNIISNSSWPFSAVIWYIWLKMTLPRNFPNTSFL